MADLNETLKKSGKTLQFVRKVSRAARERTFRIRPQKSMVNRKNWKQQGGNPSQNVHTVEEEMMDSESDEEISRRRPSRRVIEIDNSSDDEHEISGNNRKRSQSRHVIESSDAEDQLEVTAEEIHENIPNYEKNENQVEDT